MEISEKENSEIIFYRENNILPDIDEQKDPIQFMEKRKKLYRQLGIPLLCIEGKNVVEFGASSGKNSLLLATGFGNIEKRVQHIDIVEPNETGRDEIRKLFKKSGVPSELYTLYSDTLESFSAEKKYDIIIAEQFLQHCLNWKECVEALKRYASPNSIIVITCSDSIGLYVELMKRFVGRCLVSDIKELDRKVQKLIVLFAEHLNSLKGMNKPHKVYIADNFFCDFFLNGAQMNIMDAIEAFEDDFDVLGTSQNIFTDYSWYKDLDYDYISDYKKQYQQKKHMFLFAGEAEESIRSVDENILLENAIEQAIKFEADCEKRNDFIDIEKWSNVIDKVSKAANSGKMTCFNREFLEILKRIKNNEIINLSEYAIFANSYGKSSQYISFVRKY